MKPPARTAIIVVAVAALQAVAVIAYLRIERARAPDPPFPVSALPGSLAPPLIVSQPTGVEVDISSQAGRVRIVHFWATWCRPCRKELPELLARANELDGVEFVAVSVDDTWEVVRQFFPAGIPSSIVRAKDPTVHRTYGALALPDTYVMTPDGRLVERVSGARDWSSAPARRYLGALAERHR